MSYKTNTTAPSLDKEALIGPIIPESRQNATEIKFEDQVLNPMLLVGEILDFRFEPVKFLLSPNIKGGANAVSYTPDYMVVYPDHFEFIEIKAKRGKWTSMRDDARAKVNICASMYPWFKWTVWYLEAGNWIEEGLN